MEIGTTADGGLATAVICIADDVFRDAILNIAVEAGFIALSDVGRGNQIVDVVGPLDPAVVVIDLTLTGMDGIATVAALHAVAPDTVIVVSSPFATDPASALTAGATQVVSEGDVAGVRSVFAEMASQGRRSTNAPLV